MSRKFKKYTLLCVTCLLHTICLTDALNLPGPRVYVVTPAPKPLQIDEGRAAPFYYHNWVRRMDTSVNMTTSTTTTPTEDTHDLIFAEFGSDNGDNVQKSIRKLLEREKVKLSSTTAVPSFMYGDTHEQDTVKEWAPVQNDNANTKEDGSKKMNDFISMYNNLYNSAPAPVFLPSTTQPPPPPPSPTTSSTSTATAPDIMDVKNIWHIIDEEKYNQYSGKWEEQDIMPHNDKDVNKEITNIQHQNRNNGTIYNDISLPGFTTSSDKGENESRAIRTEPNIRFPYVNLKTFQMKKPAVPMYKYKKGNDVYTNLDNFQDIKYPVRGEAQDFVHNRAPIERYNSAQPYFPPDQQKNSKQSVSKPSGPMKTLGSLVPPPPPPKSFNDYLPPPPTYESFPPYPPSLTIGSDSNSPTGPDNSQPPSYPPLSADDDSDSDSPPTDSDDSNGPPPGYQYTPPSDFVPTVQPPMMKKPYKGYNYEKPQVSEDPVAMDVDSRPKYKYMKPPPIMPPEDYSPPSYSYGSHDHYAPHDDHDDDHHHSHDSGDYSDLIFKKPQEDPPADDSKGDDDMGMMPPPPPKMKPDSSPMDSGFPNDFPGDFKYHDDFEDFYHDHHHHHHHETTTTTTTTTEMPRVNRYSYYYLGKKLYYIPLYFSAYFVAYVAALVIKAILRHKIVYPNSYRPNDSSASFLSKRSVDPPTWNVSDEKLHEVTRLVTDALYNAAEKYMTGKSK